MDKDIKILYGLLCKSDNPKFYYSRYLTWSVKNNFEHVISNWGFTCVDIYKNGEYADRIGLIPETMWEPQ